MDFDVYIGSILMFCGDYAPRGWHFCDGTKLKVAQYQALFAIIRNRFGGDGVNDFALPDLRGRVVLGMGTDPSAGTNYALGTSGGNAQAALTVANLPAHTHALQPGTGGSPTVKTTVPAFNGLGTVSEPGANTVLAVGQVPAGKSGTYPGNIYSTSAPNVQMPGSDIALANVSVGNTGGGAALSLMQPYLAINYIIALEGIFPVKE